MKNAKKKKINQRTKKKSFKKQFRKNIQRALVEHLGWKKSSAEFASRLVCSLILVTMVWHKKLALGCDSKAQKRSVTRRIQRFFADTVINYDLFSAMLYKLLGLKGKLTIVLDRTNWDFGESHINIFVAGVLVKTQNMTQGFVVPLAWVVFNKKGNSNTEERKDLMEKIVRVVGEGNIETILADREFIGDEWIAFLHKHKIPFIIRLRKNLYVEYEGKLVHASDLIGKAQYGEKGLFDVKIKGISVKLAATRSIDGELVILIASLDVPGDPLDRYRLRWLIELFFRSIKTRGFNLEGTHMTKPARIKSLFALIALASVCTVHAGIMRHSFKKIPIKNHGRPTYSLFTYGLDFLQSLFSGGPIPSWMFQNLFEGPLFALKQEQLRAFPPQRKQLISALDGV